MQKEISENAWGISMIFSFKENEDRLCKIMREAPLKKQGKQKKIKIRFNKNRTYYVEKSQGSKQLRVSSVRAISMTR